MNILEISKKIIAEGPICDHCLGRQFGKLSTGLTNDERGKALKLSLAMEADRLSKEGSDSLFSSSIEGTPCWVCNGLFEELDVWAEMALAKLSKYEYSTILVGTIISGLLSENEEILWTESGTLYAEPLKSELNREIGKIISQKTGKEVDFEYPDVVVMLDIAENDVKLQVRSVYIYGRYRKLIRGIPQTRWPCRKCRGRGCESCEYTGKQYPVSVDELIREHVIEATRCADTKFHGAGREDIDALMLGNGRPFVVEAVDPVFRVTDLKLLENKINERSGGKIEVEGLKLVSKEVIESLKSSKADKVYNLKVTFKEPVSEKNLRYAVEHLAGSDIKQQTPQRVVHRRADIVRERRVHGMELDELNEDYAIIRVYCAGGLYVKELISSDDGRTVPSLSGILGVQAEVVELDVVDVKM